MKIRYYADSKLRSWHERAVELLEGIYKQHSIPVEIVRITDQYGELTGFPGDVHQSTPAEVYERDLKNNEALIETIDEKPSTAYKKHGTLDIAGNIAIVDENGAVKWASTYPGYADGYGTGIRSNTAIDFLEDIVFDPSNRICTDCLDLLNGGESFCPNCGQEFPNT